MTNCPNCGAPIPHDGQCEYCGTMVILSEHEIPVVVKIDHECIHAFRFFNKSTGLWEWTQEYTKTEE